MLDQQQKEAKLQDGRRPGRDLERGMECQEHYGTEDRLGTWACNWPPEAELDHQRGVKEGESSGCNERTQRLKCHRKWKEVFLRTREGKDNQTDRDFVMRKLGRKRRKKKSGSKSEAMERQEAEESKMHLELNIKCRGKKNRREGTCS
jgi:hypothetical protein